MIFWLNFQNFNKYRSFGNVFVACVVLGWLKPTKLCKIVKIMWQFAITFCLDDANAKFVSWCRSIYTRYQNFCTNDREILRKIRFCCWIQQLKQTIWIWNNGSRSYTRFMIGLSSKFCCSWNLHNQIWFFDSNFEVLTNTSHFLTFLLIVLYLADWNRPNFPERSKYVTVFFKGFFRYCYCSIRTLLCANLCSFSKRLCKW